MTSTIHSAQLKSLYIARFLLEATGILLVLGAIFNLWLAYGDHRGLRGGLLLNATLMLAIGIGFLLPQLLSKLLASLSLAGAGIWTFCIDAYRLSNLKIYWLFIVPLLLTLWLRKGLGALALRRLQNAN